MYLLKSYDPKTDGELDAFLRGYYFATRTAHRWYSRNGYKLASEQKRKRNLFEHRIVFTLLRKWVLKIPNK